MEKGEYCHMSVGSQIANLRKKNNMTQDELAKELGIKRGALSHYEKDRRDLSTALLIQIADFFNVSLDVVAGRLNTYQSAELTNEENQLSSLDLNELSVSDIAKVKQYIEELRIERLTK